MPFRKRAAVVIVLAVVYFVAMFLLTHLPIDVRGEATGVDKLAHFTMYAGLAALLLAAANLRWPVGATAACAVVLLAAAYGALDEWTQGFVGRTADFRDWVADIAGALFGTMLYMLGRRISGQGKPRSD